MARRGLSRAEGALALPAAQVVANRRERQMGRGKTAADGSETVGHSQERHVRGERLGDIGVALLLAPNAESRTDRYFHGPTPSKTMRVVPTSISSPSRSGTGPSMGRALTSVPFR